MGTPERREQGFSVTWVLIFMFVLAVVGFVGWKVFNKDSQTKNGSDSSSQASLVRWEFNGDSWSPSGDAPACEDPLAIGAPMEMNLATSKLYPGQVRGNDFKPHGGLGIDDAPDNNVTVYAVRDAWVYQGSRYIENGVVQYLFDFMDSCGIRYRYDHLAKLSDELAQIANQLPEPKQDDSRTSNIDPVFIKKGAVLATEVSQDDNVFFDLGVYDLRKQNAASKTAIYKTDNGRIQDKEQSFFAVCWFDLLPADAKTTADSLPSRSGSEGASSDYCTVD